MHDKLQVCLEYVVNPHTKTTEQIINIASVHLDFKE